jgi:hypothetical protein
MPEALLAASGGVGDTAAFQRGVTKYAEFTLPTSAANAKVIPFYGHSGGSIYVSAACVITWYSTDAFGNAVKAAFDDQSTPEAVTQSPAAEGWYDIPAALFGAAFIAPVIASGSITAKIMLKK